MKRKKLFFGVLTLFIAFSCTDEGRFIASYEPIPFKASIDAANEFLEINSLSFTQTSGGLNFLDNSLCPSRNVLIINSELLNLRTTGCYSPSDYINSSSFFVLNSIDGFGGEKFGFISVLISNFSNRPNSSSPPSGSYYLKIDCQTSICYPSLQVSIFTVDRKGNLFFEFFGVPDKVNLINEGGKISISFDETIFSSWGPSDGITATGTVSCCL